MFELIGNVAFNVVGMSRHPASMQSNGFFDRAEYLLIANKAAEDLRQNL